MDHPPGPKKPSAIKSWPLAKVSLWFLLQEMKISDMTREDQLFLRLMFK